MILEHYADCDWQYVATVGLDGGRRFLERLRRPQPWRLRDGNRVWKVQAWSGRVIWWRDTTTSPVPHGNR